LFCSKQATIGGSSYENVTLIFKAVALGMGVSTLVLSILGSLSIDTAITLLSIGVSSIAIVQLQDNEK